MRLEFHVHPLTLGNSLKVFIVASGFGSGRGSAWSEVSFLAFKDLVPPMSLMPTESRFLFSSAFSHYRKSFFLDLLGITRPKAPTVISTKYLSRKGITRP